MIFNYEKIPTELKKLKRWVLFRIDKVDGRETKIPINANSGYGAKSNDPETWTTFDYALSKVDYYKCHGIGFMLGNGYFGVDLDKLSESEEAKEVAKEFVSKLNSYTEWSQSKNGIHIICKGKLPPGARRKGHIEMYDNARFFAMTGNVISGVNLEVEERSKEIKELFEKYIEKKLPKGSYLFKRSEIYGNKNNNIISNSNKLSDDEVITRAIESKNGSLFSCLYYGSWEGIYKSQSEADMAFCSLLAFWTGKDAVQMERIFRNSKLYRPKWDTKRGQETYGSITIDNAIKMCQDVYSQEKEENGVVYNAQTGEVMQTKNYDLSDTGNAQRFIDKYGESLRYNFDNKCWVYWNGKTWIKDITQVVKSKADLLIEEMKKEALNEPNEKYAVELFKNVKRLSSNTGKEAMLKEAMHMKGIATTNADYDKNKYLLNCNNGVVDLRNGVLLEHNKNFMMSKNTNIDVDLNGEPTEWKRCLLNIFLNKQDMVDFIQKAIGYSLTGDTKEQCFFQCYGNGSNGKSVFFNTLYNCLGDYILNAQVESILTRNNNAGGASSDIARMKGARFVRTNEPNEGARFNEGLVKQLTGGDVITARFLYGGEFEYRPEFKLWIACNYKLIVRGTDKGIWRRMRLIPFEAVFEGENDDKTMESKLQKELPQILGWAIKGCLKWQAEGLGIPKDVEVATNEYRQEMDIVETFCKDCVLKRPNAREKATDVFEAYRKWAIAGNEWCMTQSKFGIEMGKKFEKKNINGYVYYLGLLLKKNDRSYVFTKEDR